MSLTSLQYSIRSVTTSESLTSKQRRDFGPRIDPLCLPDREKTRHGEDRRILAQHCKLRERKRERREIKQTKEEIDTNWVTRDLGLD